MSFRVPTVNVSVVDLTVKLKKPATMEQIVEAFKKAENGHMKGVIGVCEQPLVSTDFVGEPRTCVFDVEASILLSPQFVKLVAWYDNEWGYSCKLVDLAKHISC